MEAGWINIDSDNSDIPLFRDAFYQRTKDLLDSVDRSKYDVSFHWDYSDNKTQLILIQTPKKMQTNKESLELNAKYLEVSLNSLKNICHGLASDAGWHSAPREVGTMLMLIVSEISEAMEGDRKNLMDDHLPNRKMLEVELADAVIRIMDLSGREGLDIGGAIVEKLQYNQYRPDHKKENREREGGKSY
jgi:NTP pyrophosphatase (non-canonical NTP hydrolase)